MKVWPFTLAYDTSTVQ